MVYRWNGILPDPKPDIAAVHRNALDDMIRYPSTHHEPNRQTFLQEAMKRLETGETAYTMVADGRLVCSGWVQPEQTSAGRTTIHGIRAESEYHDQLEVLISQMLCDLKDRGLDAVYLSIDQAEQGVPDWIRDLGFAPASASPSQPPPQAGEV